MSGRITRQVQKTLLESGEKGWTYPMSKIGHSGLPNRILRLWLDRPLIRNSDTLEISMKKPAQSSRREKSPSNSSTFGLVLTIYLGIRFQGI
jgi:hypothetical protein